MTGGGDSRDWDDVWQRLGAAGSKGRGQRRRRWCRSVQIFLVLYVSGKATRTQGAQWREGGLDYVLCRTQSFALHSP